MITFCELLLYFVLQNLVFESLVHCVGACCGGEVPRKGHRTTSRRPRRCRLACEEKSHHAFAACTSPLSKNGYALPSPTPRSF